MWQHTSLRVGGPAELFAQPLDEGDLAALLKVADREGIPVTVIGRGFNLLARDGGIRGLVVSLTMMTALKRLDESRISAEAGVWSMNLARFAQKQGLTGLEFTAGIPGSVGGLLTMNAGAHGRAILDSVETLGSICAGSLQERRHGELEYGYRYLRLAPGEIVTRAVFRLTEGEPETIERTMQEMLAQRKATQNVGYPNAGSFFKNPEGAAAWKLIDESGLRGATVGGAQVSEVHTNFLVNAGGATAADFIELAALIKERVKVRTGIELEEEVKIVGEA
jgi:UDP-N-acetylmuramate dehydrogenase